MPVHGVYVHIIAHCHQVPVHLITHLHVQTIHISIHQSINAWGGHKHTHAYIGMAFWGRSFGCSSFCVYIHLTVHLVALYEGFIIF